MLGLLTSSTFYAASLCQGGSEQCLAAAVGLTEVGLLGPADFATNQSTVVSQPDQPNTAAQLLGAVQLASTYLLVLGVAVLIILELFELRYLRALQSRRMA